MPCKNEERNRGILEMYTNGVLMREIADTFGLTEKGVRYVLNRMGVVTNRPKGKKRVAKKPPREAVAEIPGSTWKPIKEYEGLYEVSDKGQVRSLPRKDNKGAIHKGRVLRTRNTRNSGDGYWAVMLSKDGIEKQITVHRLVASAFCSNPENKSDINHRDGNKKNNEASNLEWVTKSENVRHAYDTGLNPKGQGVRKRRKKHNADG